MNSEPPADVLPARSHAARVARSGVVWFIGAALAVGLGGTIGGNWSLSGPMLLGWLILALSALRACAGLLMLFRWSDAPPGHSSGDDAWAPPPFRSAVEVLDWQTLGLAPGSPRDAIVRAYRGLARVWHPDLQAGGDDLRERAEQRMKRVNAAYERLTRAGDMGSQSGPSLRL